MKKALVSVIVLMIGILGGSYYTVFELCKRLRKSEKEKELAIELTRKSVITTERIKSMTKTLMVAYNLDKWMAHYLSVIFNDFSDAYNIPWEIYASIVRIESGFKTTLVSSKGAKGVMQILESTGKGVASSIDLPYVESQTLWNEIHNLCLGCTYLSENIKKSGLEGGVKSYLGGPAYLKTIQSNGDHRTYISEYKSSVWVEFKKLSYIYRGIVDELRTDLNESYTYKQLRDNTPFYTVPVNIDLFKSDSVVVLCDSLEKE